MTQRKPTPDDRAKKASPRDGAPGSGPKVEPGTGTPTTRFEWPRLVAGLVILGMSLFLTVAQGTAPEGSGSILLSGPMGMALNIGGIVAGAWLIWTTFRR
jgi:hypothetical protein